MTTWSTTLNTIQGLLPTEKALPQSFEASIVFASACIVTAQIGIGIILGTTSFGLLNIIIILGCWIGYGYANNSAYLEQIEETSQKLQAQAITHQERLKEQGTLILSLKESIQKLEEENTKLNTALNDQSNLQETFQSQLEEQKSLVGERKNLIQMRAGIVEQKKAQLEQINAILASFQGEAGQTFLRSNPQLQAALSQFFPGNQTY